MTILTAICCKLYFPNCNIIDERSIESKVIIIFFTIQSIRSIQSITIKLLLFGYDNMTLKNYKRVEEAFLKKASSTLTKVYTAVKLCTTFLS